MAVRRSPSAPAHSTQTINGAPSAKARVGEWGGGEIASHRIKETGVMPGMRCGSKKTKLHVKNWKGKRQMLLAFVNFVRIFKANN